MQKILKVLLMHSQNLTRELFVFVEIKSKNFKNKIIKEKFKTPFYVWFILGQQR